MPTAANTPTATSQPTSTPNVPRPTDTPAPPPSPTPTPAVAFTPGVPNTVELTASKDNTLFQSSVGATSNGAGQGLFAGKTNNGSLRRALVQFDIASAVPSGAIIDSVELTQSVTRTVTQVDPVAVHRVTTEWGEGASDASANEGGGAGALAGDATWTHAISPDRAWQTDGGDFAPSASSQINVQGNGAYTWRSNPDLVRDVQSWVDNPASNFGWILIGRESDGRSAKRFASREFATESQRPKLVITFTPPE